MKSRQFGFAHVSFVILAVVLLLVGAGGYYVYQKNKVVDVAGTVQPGAVPKKSVAKTADQVTANSTVANAAVDFLKVKLLLPQGWSIATSKDDYGTTAIISNPDKDLTVVATESTRPVGFEGMCDGHGVDAGAKTFVNTDTRITDVSVLGLEHTDGVSILRYSMELVSKPSKFFRSIDVGKGFDAADATDVSVGNLKNGATYYYCSPLTPPFYWSVNFDYQESTQDGIYVSTKQKSEIKTPIASMSGYDDVLSILKSVVR